ncbi:MAG: 16S rRNA (adenine(1518)-N(6)/adenine(1519)-N(6))-dimethyltransferase RsmA [Candidatus Staskawiczbacteria bacterium]|nr:16S rRNA (adenine(1518)-N(6)/adenine(1519)-N(6))-dimethyltransferase RsmA [Candidatus Staskawiczbacteria bacterium]
MDLTSPKNIKGLLAEYGAKPSKGLGQNFLIDKHILEKIIKTADIKSDDIILEVGPGIGTLTQELAKKAEKVIAVEKDKKMCEVLKETLKDFKNIEIINDDILKIKKLEKFKNYKVAANIPYYLTSPLIRKLLEVQNPPEFMVLMVQKEVAQRICSKPPDMSILAVSVQFYAEPKIISYVSKNCFWPAPKVDSAIIKIIPRRSAEVPFGSSADFRDSFFQVVKAGFAHPRKQLVNNLSTLKLLNGVKLDKRGAAELILSNNLKPTQRPETLNVSDWVNLTEYLTKSFEILKTSKSLC